MTNEQYFKLEELKHKYNQKLMKAQEANDEIESTYFSGVVNGIQIAAWTKSNGAIPEQEAHKKPLKDDGSVAIKKCVGCDAVQLSPHLDAIRPTRNVPRAVGVINLTLNPAGKG